MVLCIGDSLTLGVMGYSYIPFLRREERIVNLGVNGDSLWGGTRRLRSCLKKSKYKSADTVIISLGTNDILLPYLSGRSLFWKAQCRLRNLYRSFSSDIWEFAERYETIVRELADEEYKVVLIGLPYIQLAGYPLGKVEAYNDCIRSTAKRYGAQFIDIYSMQSRHVKKVRTCSWGRYNFGRLADGMFMLLFPHRKDVLSRKRGLAVTVDGVHFNSGSARLLAGAVERVLG